FLIGIIGDKALGRSSRPISSVKGTIKDNFIYIRHIIEAKKVVVVLIGIALIVEAHGISTRHQLLCGIYSLLEIFVWIGTLGPKWRVGMIFLPCSLKQ